MFARHGVPFEMIADNTPFASPAMKKDAESWNFKITTSPGKCPPPITEKCLWYAQSNGMAERVIQTVETIDLYG